MFPPGAGSSGSQQQGAQPPASSSSSNSSSNSSSSSSGLPSLHAVVVQLDGKFITEITHTAALFAELFPPGGRKRLIKVRSLVSWAVLCGYGRGVAGYEMV